LRTCPACSGGGGRGGEPARPRGQEGRAGRAEARRWGSTPNPQQQPAPSRRQSATFGSFDGRPSLRHHGQPHSSAHDSPIASHALRAAAHDRRSSHDGGSLRAAAHDGGSIMDTLAFGARGGAGARTRHSMMETLAERGGERGSGAGGAGVRTRPSNDRAPSHQPGHLALGQLVSARSARSDAFDEYEVCHQLLLLLYSRYRS